MLAGIIAVPAAVAAKRRKSRLVFMRAIYKIEPDESGVNKEEPYWEIGGVLNRMTRPCYIMMNAPVHASTRSAILRKSGCNPAGYHRERSYAPDQNANLAAS